MKAKKFSNFTAKKKVSVVCTVIFLTGLFIGVYVIKPLEFGKLLESHPRITRYSHLSQGPNNERIFFQETSGADFLHMRQLCAIESAALHNPQRPVQLFLHSTKEPSKCSKWVQVLSKYPNIEIVLLNETHYFASSPFDTWYLIYNENRDADPSSYRMSQIARILNSFRHGGTYLDLDMLVLKKIDEKALNNFFAFLTPQSGDDAPALGSNAYHLTHGSEILNKIVSYLSTQFDWISGYSDILEFAINEVMKKACSESNEPKDLSFGMSRCANVSLLPPDDFNFLSPDNVSYMFGLIADENPLKSMEKSSLGVHFWDSVTHSSPLMFDFKLPLSLLAKEHCPLTEAQSFLFVEKGIW